MAKQRQSATQAVASATQGGGGGFQGTAQALQGFIQSITQGASKLMQTMQEQQIQTAQQGQQMGQDMANQVTSVLSGVASAGARADEERRQQADKQEDREYAEDVALWQQDLQKESSIWAGHLAEKIQQQESARIAYVQDYERETETWASYRDAVRSDIQDKMNKGYFLQVPNGIEEYQIMMKALDHSEAFVEDRRGAPYLTMAVQHRNAAVSKIYAQEAGNLGMELTPQNPDLMPLPQPAQGVEGDLPFLDDSQLRDVRRGRGYPATGTRGLAPDDPMSRHINPYTSKSALWHMQADQSLRTLVTQKGRKIMEQGLTKKILQASDALRPYTELEEQMASTYDAVANQAIHEGVMDFIADPNPQKYGAMPENITRKIIDRAMGTPEGSKKAYAMLNGEMELQSRDGLQVGLGMYTLGQVMGTRIRQTLGDPTSQASQALMAELQNRTKDPLSQFGRVKGGQNIGAGDRTTLLYREMWGTMSQVADQFKRLEKVSYDQGPVKGLYDEIAVLRRAADTQALVLQSEDEGGEDLTPENIQKKLQSFQAQAAPSEGFKRNIGYVEGMAIQFKDHPNPVGAIHNLLSGGKAGVQNPNQPAFQAILENQKQLDPYLNQQEAQKTKKAQERLSYTQMGARAFGAGLGKMANAASGITGEIGKGMQAAGAAVQSGVQDMSANVQQGYQAAQAPPTPPGAPQPKMDYQSQQQRGMMPSPGIPPIGQPQPGQPPTNPMEQLQRTGGQ